LIGQPELLMEEVFESAPCLAAPVPNEDSTVDDVRPRVRRSLGSVAPSIDAVPFLHQASGEASQLPIDGGLPAVGRLGLPTAARLDRPLVLGGVVDGVLLADELSAVELRVDDDDVARSFWRDEVSSRRTVCARAGAAATDTPPSAPPASRFPGRAPR